jgi:hypothetical protein
LLAGGAHPGAPSAFLGRFPDQFVSDSRAILEPIVADGTERGTASYCPDACAKGPAMSVLISILITFLVVILVLYLVNMLPIDGRAKQIVQAIVIIIGVLSLLRYLAVF